MYTEKYQQTGNACGAATLMIALHERDDKKPVDSTTEAKLFEHTRDPGLSKLLGVPEKDTDDYFSSPANIQSTAKGQGLTASLFVLADAKNLPPEVAKLKVEYVDALKPAEVDTAGLKNLLNTGPLQLLVYTDGNVTAMHWLLLRKDGNKAFVYDTACATNTEVDPDAILAFHAPFKTPRQNNFFGAAFLLTPA